MLSHGVQVVGINDRMLSEFIKVKAETSEDGSLAAHKWELYNNDIDSIVITA